MVEWQNKDLSLGERCVLFSLNEMKLGVKESSPNSFTSPRIIEYFSICTRLVNGKETPLKLKSGNWCAISACFALHKSLLPNEIPPHGYRAGVVEVIADLKSKGLWHSRKDVLDLRYKIKIGDIVATDRSTPGKPETSWYRHCLRVSDVTDKGFECISGNSSGMYKISKHKYDQLNLVGFGEYPELNYKIKNVTDVEEIDWNTFSLEDVNPTIDMDETFDFSKGMDLLK